MFIWLHWYSIWQNIWYDVNYRVSKKYSIEYSYFPLCKKIYFPVKCKNISLNTTIGGILRKNIFSMDYTLIKLEPKVLYSRMLLNILFILRQDDCGQFYVTYQLASYYGYFDRNLKYSITKSSHIASWHIFIYILKEVYYSISSLIP